MKKGIKQSTAKPIGKMMIKSLEDMPIKKMSNKLKKAMPKDMKAMNAEHPSIKCHMK